MSLFAVDFPTVQSRPRATAANQRANPADVEEVLKLKLYEQISKNLKAEPRVKHWRFDITRDDTGLIESVEAHAVTGKED